MSQVAILLLFFFFSIVNLRIATANDREGKMVSPLSSRILDLEAKAKSINCPQFQEAAQIKKDSSAFVQKTEEFVGLDAKKRKIEELNYQAANVHADLARAKIQHESNPAERKLRAFPHGSANINEVKLINVSKNTPYVEEVTTNSSELFNVSVFSDLIRSSEQFYSIRNNKDIAIDGGDGLTRYSSTNSFSMSENLIPAKSEDYGKYEETKSAKEESENNENHLLKDIIFRSAVCCSNLEDVLNNQSSARLVTAPNHPYLILHASAAFSQLTEISSDKIIGRPLANIVKIDSMHESNGDISISFSSNDRDSTELLNPSIRCSLMTSKIYSGSTMTHLSIDIAAPNAGNADLGLYDYGDELDSVLEFIALAG